MRKERDILGEVDIDENSYTGIHTKRAVENFSVSGYRIDDDFIRAYGLVKLACAKTILDIDEEDKFEWIIKASEELAEGKLSQYIVTDALQGGAGTSLNMNVNEVIANRALELGGHEKGDYKTVSPLNDVNRYQSTNDTFPTALKIAGILKFRKLEQSVIKLQEALQKKEQEFSRIVKIGRTQLQEAVLTTLGKEFSAYAESISRDRWRIYKCEERLRVVNLGGTAIGTTIGAPKKFVFNVINELQDLTGIGVSRAENLVDNTQNADVFAEVSGILKANATNLIKVSNDLRLMTSFGEIELPARQAGSSIMPGKINPVIPEMAVEVGLKVLGNDCVISHACALGQLELNQNLPLIAFCLLESLEILTNANVIMAEKCVDGIRACEEKIKEHLNSSTAVLTALLPKIGYEKLSEISHNIKLQNKNVKEYVIENGLLTEGEFDELLSPESILGL